MELKIFDNYSSLSAAVAAMLIDFIKKKPEAVFCLATGDTPKLTYHIAVETIRKENIDTSHCFFIGLDEWFGIKPENSGSCHYYLNQYFFTPAGIMPEQIHLFDALAADENEECEKMNRIITAKGGIDFMLVGVGMNGHIGLNEPGTSMDTLAHAAPLEEMTKTTGQKYFKEQAQIEKGITIGLKQVMEARTLVLMANGKKKSAIIKQALEDEINTGLPASLIRRHINSFLMIDAEAAGGLKMI
jgi:glucosamine-6-phosphate isomerase